MKYSVTDRYKFPYYNPYSDQQWEILTVGEILRQHTPRVLGVCLFRDDVQGLNGNDIVEDEE